MIKGINEKNPYHDKAIISPNVDALVSNKNAWEISEVDWLSFAITSDDRPMIPPFIKDPLVIRVMERLRRFKK